MPDVPLPPWAMQPASLWALFWVFTKLGMASFGGGLSGWIHGEAVERRRWLSEEQFIAGVAFTQVLPGPNAVNLALFIGQRLRGGPGLVVSGLGILLPPFVFILVLAAGYGAISGVPGLQFVLSGMAAAGIGMTLVVGVRSAWHVRGLVPVGFAMGVFVAVGLLQWPMLAVVGVAAPLSVLFAWRNRERGRG